MEGLFGGTQAPLSQGQDDVFGLGTGSQQVQSTAQLGDLHGQQLFGGQVQVSGQQQQVMGELQQFPNSGQQQQGVGNLQYLQIFGQSQQNAGQLQHPQIQQQNVGQPQHLQIQQQNVFHSQTQQQSAGQLQYLQPSSQQSTDQLPQQALGQPAQNQQPLQQVSSPQTREQIVADMIRIGQQIGKEVDLKKVRSMSDFDLQQQYFEALKDAQQSEQPQQLQDQQMPSEIERLQKQNEEMGKLLAQLMGMNQQQSFPQYGQQMTQFPGQYQHPQQTVSPQQFQQMQYQPQIQPQLQLPQINSEEFYAKLEENPSKAIAEITTPLVEKALAEQAQQFQSYLHQIKEQQQREQQIQQFYSQQIDYLKQTHPDFDQYRHVAAQILNERPHYAMMENGLVYAYEEAKRRVQAYNQQQMQYQQPVTQQQVMQKQVAALPGTVNFFQEPQPQNPFGNVTRKGIFG